MFDEPILLTNTALSTYRLCPRKYRNRYILRLARKRRATALRFGSGFHRGLELRATRPGDSDEAILASVLEEYGPCPEWAEPTDWAVERETLRQLLAGHFWNYSRDDLHHQAVELTFATPLEHFTGRPNRHFHLAGKIDGIVLLSDGRLAVLEYKTAGEDIGTGSEYWPRLRCDGQISLYMLGARAMGHDVSTILYDVTRKPTIRLRKDETPEAYSERLRADIDARPDYYYQRHEVPRLEDELAEFGMELWQQAQSLQDSIRHDRWYRNVSRITCSNCEFSELCFNNVRIDPTIPPSGFEYLSNAHPELSSGESQ